MTAATKSKTPKRSLVEYAQLKKREAFQKNCKVCQLDEHLKLQVSEARQKRITGEVIVEWLQREYGIKLVVNDFVVHVNGRHDERIG